MIIVLLIFITLLIYLFTFYMFARDDYYFIRKGITMEQLFNVLLLGLFWGFLIARLLFVVLHFKQRFLNPIVFLLVPYEPGLSLFGWVIGIFLGITYLTKRRKIHSARFFDYVSIASLAAFPIWSLGVYFIDGMSNVLTVVSASLYFVCFLFFSMVLFPKFTRGKMKEGSISILFLIIVSLLSLVGTAITMITKHIMQLQIEDYLFICLCLISVLLYVRLKIKSN
jgi:hypothetical protein